MASPNSPDETTDELIADLTAKHGPELAAIAYRAITGQMPVTGQRGRTASTAPTHDGRRPKRPPAIPEMPHRTGWKPPSGLNWHDGYKGRRNKSGLPNSGAPSPPKRQPRPRRSEGA